MNDLVVKTKVMPKIQFNYDDIKEHVAKEIEKYDGLVVTLETLKGCEESSKELSSLRIKLDKFRKEIKKEVKKPIDLFEDKIKELVANIDKVQAPIKEGIQTFEDKRKEEVKQLIINKFNKAATDLTDKYKAMFIVDEKLLNKTVTQKAVKASIDQQVTLLKQAQDKEASDIELIKMMVETENKTLLTKLDNVEFLNKLTPENSLDIVRDMQGIAERQRKAEEAAKQAAEAPKVEEVVPPPEPAPQVERVEESIISVNIRLTGTRTQLNRLKEYMAGQDIKWSNL